MAERKAHRCVRCQRVYWQEDMRLCLQMPGAPLHPGAGPFQPRPSPDDALWVCRRGRGCRTELVTTRDLVLLAAIVACAIAAVALMIGWLEL